MTEHPSVDSLSNCHVIKISLRLGRDAGTDKFPWLKLPVSIGVYFLHGKWFSLCLHTKIDVSHAIWLDIHPLRCATEDDGRCWVCHVWHCYLRSPSRVIPQQCCDCYSTCFFRPCNRGSHYLHFLFLWQGVFEVASGLGYTVGPPLGGFLYAVEYTFGCSVYRVVLYLLCMLYVHGIFTCVYTTSSCLLLCRLVDSSCPSFLWV